ncbi:Sulfoquinovosyl transferase sqd2 [Borealophlyctis nickersoniae]|nr:Sulfoquinovosyl transferase sqd2 [Borealophlyctis nickersoniae]
MATEYLPPYVSGIANRCKNLVKGYRENGHEVTVASCAGTACDIVVPSVPNLFYPRQRMFLFPPLVILWQLLNFTAEVPYDIIHVVGPLCLPFVFLLPLFKLRGVRIYVSYHVYLEYYKNMYFNKMVGDFLEWVFVVLYFWPLVWCTDVVGIPSKTADFVVFKYARRIHYMKSGLDTNVFCPREAMDDEEEEEGSSAPVASLLADSKPNLTAVPASVVEGMGEKEAMRLQFSKDSAMLHHDSKKDDPEEACPPHPMHMPLSPPATPPPMRRGNSSDNLPAYSSAATADSSPSPAPATATAGPTLVYVGRLAPEKNVEFLVSALSHPYLSNATLVIVGDGPSRASLERLARDTVGEANVTSKPTTNPPSSSSSLSAVAAATEFTSTSSSPSTPSSPQPPASSSTTGPRVHFTGMLLSERAIATAYATATVFVSASASETFGFTVAEALACGTPSVVVRSGAFASVYKMIDEWMFDEGDVEAYVEGVRRVVMGGKVERKRARKIAVRWFGVGAAVKDLLAAYEGVVSGVGSGDIGKEKDA